MFKEIADYLLNIDKEKATGLLVGNAGVSLFLYQVYRKTGQTEFEETADIMQNHSSNAQLLCIFFYCIFRHICLLSFLPFKR